MHDLPSINARFAAAQSLCFIKVYCMFVTNQDHHRRTIQNCPCNSSNRTDTEKEIQTHNIVITRQ
jgi:hypothetical protein